MSPLFLPLQMLLLTFAVELTAVSWTGSSIFRRRTARLRSAWAGGAFASPMPNAVDLPEKRKTQGVD
jgi:hypothetical protein